MDAREGAILRGEPPLRLGLLLAKHARRRGEDAAVGLAAEVVARLRDGLGLEHGECERHRITRGMRSRSS